MGVGTAAAVGIFSGLANYFTLYLVARRTKVGMRNLVTSRAFAVGDFFLIPMYFGMLAQSIGSGRLQMATTNEVVGLVAILSLLVILGLGIKFHLLTWVWIPHGVFAWIVVWTFLLVTYSMFAEGRGEIKRWTILLVVLLLHQFWANRLGTKYLPVK